MSLDEPVTIPITTIQPTFTGIIKEVYDGLIPYEDIWVSRYHGSDSIHARFRVILDDNDREKIIFDATNSESKKLRMERSAAGPSYTISSGESSASLLVPIQHYADPAHTDQMSPHRITALAVAADHSQFAIGLFDGSIYLYPITDFPSSGSNDKYPSPHTPSDTYFATQRQALVDPSIPGNKKAHKSIVGSLKFFPSSRVLLSGGADFSLRIFPADLPAPEMSLSSSSAARSPAHPARTLLAHLRPISSIAINPFDRGRTIVSASQDGSIRVWNVSSGTEVTERRIRHGAGGGVTGMVLDADEVQQRVYCAIQDGSFEVYDVTLPGSSSDSSSSAESWSKRIFKSPRSSAGSLTAIAISGSGKIKLLALGYANGLVSLYTIPTDAEMEKSLERPLITFRRNTASIEAFSFLPDSLDGNVGLAIATADGLPWIASISIIEKVDVVVYAELTGGEIDAVRDIVAVSSTEVWTVCDDGIARRYVIP
ncbi:wd-40 repeat protein [Moniliophthora roreri MCA 2997]|uniref:Wd-40 repeat protein n=1 Tax=Moniliophthora roreri (strain MCA 2997) TaxID=1381753 RepID=V2WTE5_MONRO|nr:wd-40 repeat protein [Moniliophthora roreri MCA 2997]KAI3607598.1 wd-40 repeat protein [Moniliophthora roreri]